MTLRDDVEKILSEYYPSIVGDAYVERCLHVDWKDVEHMLNECHTTIDMDDQFLNDIEYPLRNRDIQALLQQSGISVSIVVDELKPRNEEVQDFATLAGIKHNTFYGAKYDVYKLTRDTEIEFWKCTGHFQIEWVEK